MSMPSPTPADRALRRLAREQQQENDARRAVWGFLWTLFFFKLATIGVIMWVTAGSGETFSMIFITTWYWLVIPVAGISGPLLLRWRMIRLRRQREALQQAEFRADPRIMVMPEWGEGDSRAEPGGESR